MLRRDPTVEIIINLPLDLVLDFLLVLVLFIWEFLVGLTCTSLFEQKVGIVNVNSAKYTKNCLKHCVVFCFFLSSVLEHIEQMQPNSKYNVLLCMWTLKSYVPQYLQMMRVKYERIMAPPDERSKNEEELSIKPMGKPVHPMFHKIACFCWAPGKEKKSRAVIVTSCPFSKEPSVATMVHLADGPEPPFLPSSSVSFSIFIDQKIWYVTNQYFFVFCLHNSL